ncbi:MAG: DUF1565 domain-containing protein [Planctomycetes bacterium]|nr:DUF1565 domain-containing protein [Planctomycetota bacterium]
MPKNWKNRRLRRTIALLLLVSLILTTLGIAPGETLKKFRRYILWDRICLPIYLILTTPPENIRTTQLPVYELDIKQEYLDQLNADIEIPPPNFDVNQLFTSSRQYQPAIFRHDDVRYRVQVRYRGVAVCHYLPPQKSLRIKFKKSDRFQNQRLINLINPKTTSALVATTGNNLAQNMQLLAANTYPAHTVINRQYYGVQLFIEQIDEYFMINHHLTEGNIYYGESIYDNLWNDPNLWTCHVNNLHPLPADPLNPIIALLKTVTQSGPEDFPADIAKIMDLDQWYLSYAHAQICDDIHRDDNHNHKFYLDPTTGKLRIIIWDPLGHAWGIGSDPYDQSHHINLVFNSLVGRILQHPEFTERKNHRLFDALNGTASRQNRLDQLESWYQLIRQDIYCDINKDHNWAMPVRIYTNDEFEESIRRQREFIIHRDQFLRQQLSFSDCSISPDQTFSSNQTNNPAQTALAAYYLVNAGECGVRLPQLTLHLVKNTLLTPSTTYQLYHDTNDNAQLDPADAMLATANSTEQSRSITFSIDQSLLPARKKIDPIPNEYFARDLPYDLTPAPARHRLIIAAIDIDNHPANSESTAYFQPLQETDLRAVNSVTGTEVNINLIDNLPIDTVNGAPPFDLQDNTQIKQTLIWGPGVHRVEQDIILPPTTKLIIKPATRVLFAPNASVLTYGPVIAEGTPAEPIEFEPAQANQPWGVFALQGKNANNSRFTHCRFRRGQDDTLDNVFYSGMLNAYNCSILIENCLITDARGDDGINLKFSGDSVIRHTEFQANSADALDLDFSDCLVVNCRFIDNQNDGIDLGTSSAVLRDNTLTGCGDKAVSVGEMSCPTIYNNTITNNNVGIASKDMSKPLVANNLITHNRTGIACYQKKSTHGPSEIELVNCQITGNDQTFAADMNSSFTVHHCQLPANAQIFPLHEGIADDFIAPTQIVRTLDSPLMNAHANFNLDQSNSTLATAGDLPTVRKIIPKYPQNTPPIGLLKQ